MQDIRDMMVKAALYELLAEEAIELAHAALKQARILRGENPTPLTSDKVMQNIIEEYSDVTQCARILDLYIDEDQISRKHERWVGRLTK